MADAPPYHKGQPVGRRRLAANDALCPVAQRGKYVDRKPETGHSCRHLPQPIRHSRRAWDDTAGVFGEFKGDDQMKGISSAFFIVAVSAALGGMVWGIQMAATGDHVLSPAHGHLNLIGWVSFAIFGCYYHLVPAADQGLLPKLHFALSAAGLGLIVPGIAMAIASHNEMLAKLGSVLTLAGMLVFFVVVLRSIRK
ncbi:hypothetical protein PXK58_11955 [Phaeobacter gallaeciensis]|uniref:hypothetical protein n=1 Tax=Phaeobacter gallaeciensis TaxID=60890 RepID=UPI002380BFE0|nr:hypothetical protein [Phaeobacter gallaeciensis]MDE4274815.1 hypothetical protein [Phaeobacter gallaeciensis]MDE4300268.1 hypothetical protein [Phaeobacter gallaeciensis]MDE5185432.1 hypothetical protein [Phaeobacter gallaeciensis]